MLGSKIVDSEYICLHPETFKNRAMLSPPTMKMISFETGTNDLTEYEYCLKSSPFDQNKVEPPPQRPNIASPQILIVLTLLTVAEAFLVFFCSKS